MRHELMDEKAFVMIGEIGGDRVVDSPATKGAKVKEVLG